jgi:hypothetical protein
MNIVAASNRSVVMKIAIYGAALVGIGYGTTASAGCGQFDSQKPTVSLWEQESARDGLAKFMPASYADFRNGEIVGLWKFQFLSKNNVGIPDGTQIDFGYSEWHSDGTEILNSGGRPPITGNICMGAWERTGESSFKLNHIGLSWDSTGTVFVGPAQILEQVSLDAGGKHYSGVFSVIQYSTDEKTVLAHIGGIVTADRVTADSRL